jgi:hypothetical protein
LPDNSWNIAVDGAAHAVSVQEDPATGRAAVRVDGRIAGRPMQPADTEREFIIGTRGFAVVRTANGYDLEQGRIVAHDAPVVGGPRTPTYAGSVARPAATATATSTSGSGNGKRIGILVGILVVGAFARTCMLLPSLSYRMIRWKAYASPDRRFNVTFPGEPKREESTVRFGPSDVQSVTLTASRREHAYLVSYWDVPRLIRVDDAPRTLEAALNGITSSMSMTIDSQEQTTMAGRPALHLVARMAKTEQYPAAIDECALIADYNRIYLVQGLRPVADTYRADIETFLKSFDIPK